MNNDSTPAPAQPRTTVATATALVKLLVRAEADPAFAPMLTDVVWVVGPLTGIRGSSYLDTRPGTGQQLLEAARALFGGDIAPTGDRYNDNHWWHCLTTTVAGVPVTLRVPVTQASVEAQLRERIAELEAAAACGVGE